MALLTDAEWTDYINSLLRYDAQASVAAKLGTILRERTWLLREVYDYLYHGWDVPVGLLAEIRKAIEVQP